MAEPDASAPVAARPPLPPATAVADRIPLSQKVTYGLGSVNDVWGNWLCVGMVWPVFNIFAHVSPALVSLALMINRLFDAVSDPLFGWWSDNTRTRWGRRRPFILVGSILAGIALPFRFAVPQDWTEMQYFWWMVGSSAVFITIQKLPEVPMFFASAFVTLTWWNEPVTGEPDILRGAQVYGIILGAIMIVVGIVVARFVKERYYTQVVSRGQERVKVTESLGQTLRCRPSRGMLAMAFAYGMGTSMVGTLGYYCTVYSVCAGDVALGSKWNFAMGLMGMVMGMAGVPVFNRLARVLGKREAMKYVQISGAGVFAATWWRSTPTVPWQQTLAAGFIAFTGVGFWMLDGAIMADVIDADEPETGKRREGAFAASRSWIMKVGMAAGIFFSGVILQSTGFYSALGGDQLPHAIFSIRLYLAVIPIIGLICAFIALVRFSLTPARMAEIRTQLEARRGTV